jgi:hypothetical protein
MDEEVRTMRKAHFRIALGATLVGLVALTILLTSISFASAGDEHSLTAVAAQATARFHDLDQAQHAGWNTLVKDKFGVVCIDNQPVGGMGVHWANGPLLGDAVLDPTRPEALVYAPNAHGQPKLAALEYIVFDAAWKAAGHKDPPELFGQQFFFSPDGNRFGIPAFWALHVWIWHPNPAGTFQPWNPRVRCG